MKTTVVTTTIYVPTFLGAYVKNAQDFEQEVNFIVIGDMKTPDAARDYCNSLASCRYLDVKQQEDYLGEKYKDLKEHLPYNSIARRNIGHLMAYEEGADVIIMLDDDNLSTGNNFVANHNVVGRQARTHKTIYSSSGWYNVCDLLEEENDVRFYARGYPQKQRWHDGRITEQQLFCKSAVNAGLWINDPDIDALTRIERHLKTTGYKGDSDCCIALHPGTWSPFNCQNTAISRRALESYFLSPYTGRHLDIWASYITNRCIEEVGEVVTYGDPLANHQRSPHNLYKDLKEEMPWIEATDEFCSILRDNKRYTSNSYANSFLSCVEDLNRSRAISPQYIDGLYIWGETMEKAR